MPLILSLSKRKQPSVKTTASTYQVAVNTPTVVTVTSRITSTNVNSGSVQLHRVNANGTITSLGVMRDDGMNGDTTAGDGTHAIRFTLNQPTPTILVFGFRRHSPESSGG